jgi:putative ABC transport system permease protein
MMGTFLNLVGVVRTLLFSIAIVAVTVGVLGVFNTLLAAVVERTNELAVMRAIGASRGQIVGLITTEALLLTGAGGIAGILLALAAGHGIENLVKSFVPLAPDGTMMSLTAKMLFQSVLAGVVVGVLAGLYPAWRASRLQPAEALTAE